MARVFFLYLLHLKIFHLKGAAENIPLTLVGDGYFMSCGPQELEVNSDYLIFGKNNTFLHVTLHYTEETIWLFKNI